MSIVLTVNKCLGYHLLQFSPQICACQARMYANLLDTTLTENCLEQWEKKSGKYFFYLSANHLISLLILCNDYFKFRGQYVKRFYEDSFNRKKVCSLVDIWVFFNCVLDDNIKELKIHSTFPDSELNLQLIPTIAYWSPLLTELYIDFQLMKRTGDGTERLKLVITSMSSLQHLTDLTMLGLKRKERYCALSLIGTSCPSLTSFAVNAAFMDKKDILAFILGEFANVLLDSEEEPPWCEDVALQDLVIPSELRTPVCSKLREFLIIARFYDTENYCRISKYAAAFALRNLPLLQKMSVRIPTSLAVELIDGTTEEAKVSQVANMFAKSCREAAKRVENISVHESLKRSSLSGKF